MGARGPKSKTNIKVLPPSKIRRPNPHRGMTPDARGIWLRIVKAYPRDHFKPQHYGFLRAYCEAEALNKKAITMIAQSDPLIQQKNGVIKQNPYISIMQNTATTMATLGVKLGITVNNTTVNRGKGGSVTKPKSKREGLLFKG